ncbi:putative membrane protein [Clostridium bornimense]|uniref:Putative membrane protein n=1 Tax=Clostridium bornimense TaxID=1216932 RepID=W6RZ83_9CLOT|nr:YitT family protein [Clostridium bornimense]CDM68899.1 putative membrane protein [Clostridium bornimense]
MDEKKSLIHGESEWVKISMAVLGSLLYAIGINMFIVPVGLYSGGIMGICQIIRTILIDYMHLPLNQFDIAGIVYYIINIPIFIIAYKKMGKSFFGKTLLCVTTTSLFLSLVSVPKIPILTDDILAASLIGGIISGCGTGFILKMGCSAGGMDIVGLLCMKKNKNFSMGKITLIVNLILYSICLFMFDEKIVIYSIIFAAVTSITIDKVHIQNINVQVTIITRRNIEAMEKDIMTKLVRGVTKWNAKGGYTGQDTSILYIVLSKYEVSYLKKIIKKYDPDAFVVVNEGANIEGNYLKKL